jgi:hypothetical protein
MLVHEMFATSVLTAGGRAYLPNDKLATNIKCHVISLLSDKLTC